ncbi:MAG: glutathione peroxidase [Oceanobacter sp.]
MNMNRYAVTSRLLMVSILPVLALSSSLAWSDSPECPAIFQHQMKQLHSSKVLDLCAVSAGSPVLLVNTASHCGFTGQFGDLEKLHQQHKQAGLVVIGVASDSFNQEADSEKEAADVCFKNFGVTFTMMAPVPVSGDKAHPLFKAVGEQAGLPRWNFYKYLIDRKGRVVDSWSSFGMPDAEDVRTVM